MAVTNPPIALQNLGTHTASLLRIATTSDQAAPRVAASLVPRGGVHPFLGSAMAVTQMAAPGMGVQVAPGIATVPGTENSQQGAYTCISASNENVLLSAAHASLPRIDLIVAKVEDTQYSGAVNAWSLAKVDGTPAGSPAAPAAPNNSVILAQVTVAAAATQILNASIADKRTYASTGITVASSTTMPSPAVANMVVVQSDTGDIVRYNGSAWKAPYAPDWTSYTPTAYQNMATTPSSIASTTNYARHRKIGTTVQLLFNITISPITTGGVGLSIPYPQAQRFLSMGSCGIFGSGVPSDQNGHGYGMPSPHLDKIVIANYAGGFKDTTATSQTIRGMLTYETT